MLHCLASLWTGYGSWCSAVELDWAGTDCAGEYIGRYYQAEAPLPIPLSRIDVTPSDRAQQNSTYQREQYVITRSTATFSRNTNVRLHMYGRLRCILAVCIFPSSIPSCYFLCTPSLRSTWQEERAAIFNIYSYYLFLSVSTPKLIYWAGKTVNVKIARRMGFMRRIKKLVHTNFLCYPITQLLIYYHNIRKIT